NPAAPVPAVSRALVPGPAAITAIAIALGAWYLNAVVSWRQAALFVVGAFAGVVLYHAAFGFTSSWRVFISDRRGAGLRAQMLMLAITCAVFFPLLASGSLFGQSLRGSVSPVGVGVAAGAFIFGVGMQLGGGCASGTLFSVGGGSTRMLITLFFFIIGSVIGTAHMGWWTAQPALAPTSLVSTMGPWPGLAASLLLFGAIAWVTAIAERKRHGGVAYDATPSRPTTVRAGTPRWLTGPWPLVAGAIGLAIVNIATLTIGGRPWGVTSAFALWGAKWFEALGIDVASWSYWQAPAQAQALRSSVLLDVTSVMDFGIILGALLAAILAGRFAPTLKISGRSLAAAIVGGLLLGYGARIAYGCNIGAYFSGIASGSLHGWLWLVAAFMGNIAGTRLRPMFDLPVEKTRNAC
ncbi:MAG TPA: YeeE/YedE family protein, partial [Vicinamibacterales bacterium]|nr:YeeE/YedE family protein [Vicinamibacterales bacterium]